MGLEKAKLRNEFTGEEFFVLFNPEQYTIDRKNNFAQITVHGLSSPLLQFSHGELQTLQMELFFDSREQHVVSTVTRTEKNGDLRVLVKEFLKLMDINPELHAPPVLQFSWGKLDFRCVLASANQTYTMFREDGCPLRAKINVTFQEFVNKTLETVTVGRQTADYTKTHEVVEGDTLPGIAHKLYDDATLWRPIALFNGLSQPRSLTPGTKLLIPRLPYRLPGTDITFG